MCCLMRASRETTGHGWCQLTCFQPPVFWCLWACGQAPSGQRWGLHAVWHTGGPAAPEACPGIVAQCGLGQQRRGHRLVGTWPPLIYSSLSPRIFESPSVCTSGLTISVPPQPFIRLLWLSRVAVLMNRGCVCELHEVRGPVLKQGFAM